MSSVALALLKPDLAVNPALVQMIINRISQNDVTIVSRKCIQWCQADSEKFYEQHRHRFFYQRLVEYTTSGPMIALLLSGKNVIQDWRNLMGPTKTFKSTYSHPYTIRGEFGLTDTRNSTHGSDSLDSAILETELTFGVPLKVIMSDNDKPDENCANFMQLAKSEFWDSFYTRQDSSLEWFLSFEDIRSYLLPPIKDSLLFQPDNHPHIILDFGCGNSLIGPNLANTLRDSVDVFCIDFTLTALRRLRVAMDACEEFHDTRNCSLVKADVTKAMPFDNNSVSAIIDKGCIDSILRQDNGERKAKSALVNNLELLCKCGVLLQISDEPPDTRLDLLHQAIAESESHFDVNSQQLITDNDGEHFLYVLKKL